MATHPFFFTERSVFVVATNVNAPVEYGYDGLCISLLIASLKQWIHIVTFYAPKSSIIIVGTHLDVATQSKKKTIKSFKEQVERFFPVSKFAQIIGAPPV